MGTPPPPTPPTGLSPRTADEVNNNVGVVLRRFVDAQRSVNQTQASLAGVDLKAEPYLMTPEQETLIKSALNDLDADLDAVNMTFINQLVGIW